MKSYFQNKTILITGAASGLGRELAISLSHFQCHLILLDKNKKGLEESIQFCLNNGSQCKGFEVNLLDEDPLSSFLSKIPEVHMVFANAGVGGVNPGNAFSPEIDRKILEINYHGLVKTISPFLKSFIERGEGHIVGISSLASMRGLPGASSYSASKAAVNNFLESLRMDLSPHGVSVTTVLPGFIKTPMANHNDFDMPLTQDARTSALKILKAVSRKKKVYAFPKLMYIGTLFNRLLPSFIYNFLMPRISGQSKDLKAKIF